MADKQAVNGPAAGNSIVDLIVDLCTLFHCFKTMLVVPPLVGSFELVIHKAVGRFPNTDACSPTNWNAVHFQAVVD